MYRELTAEWRGGAGGHPEEDSSQLPQSGRVFGWLGHVFSYACPVHASSDCTHLIHPSIHFSLSSSLSLSPFPSIYLSHLCLSLFPYLYLFSTPIFPAPSHSSSHPPHSPLQPPLLCPFPAGCPQSGSPSSPQPHQHPPSPLPARSPHGLHHCWPGTGWG